MFKLYLTLLILVLLGCDLNPHARKDFTRFFNQSIDLTGNLIFYHFAEESYSGTLGDVIDDSGRGRDSNSIGGLLKSSGIYGEGILCNGSGSGVDLEVGEFDDAFTERTISVWFRANNTTGTQYIFEEGGNANGINIYIQNGVLYGHAYKGFPAPFTFQAFQSTSVQANTWYHVVLVFHHTDGLLMYINGSSIASAVPIGEGMPFHSDANGLCFQNNQSVRHDGSTTTVSFGNPFYGIVDELAVWNRTLSNQEVYDLYLRQGRL